LVLSVVVGGGVEWADGGVRIEGDKRKDRQKDRGVWILEGEELVNRATSGWIWDGVRSGDNGGCV
jgi:hypothetical protein